MHHSPQVKVNDNLMIVTIYTEYYLPLISVIKRFENTKAKKGNMMNYIYVAKYIIY